MWDNPKRNDLCTLKEAGGSGSSEEDKKLDGLIV
jgi:hypothetical protein